METATMPPEEVEGRLIAQRRALAWLLERVVTDEEAYAALREIMQEEFPEPDGQEDPGAVTTEAFARQSASTAETRLLLGGLKQRFGGD